MALIDLAQEDEPNPTIGVGDDLSISVRTADDGSRHLIFTMAAPTLLGFPLVVCRELASDEAEGLQIALGRLMRRLA